MPLRPATGTQRWSLLDLPILPFLAPRVFQPWPAKGGRRNYITSEFALREDVQLEQEDIQHTAEAWEARNTSKNAETQQGFLSEAGSMFSPILPSPKPKRRHVLGPARYRDQRVEEVFRYGKVMPAGILR
jgi:hypothetical protein